MSTRMYEHLTVQRAGRVSIVTLARPRARNAFSVALMRELTAYARAAEADGEADVVIITGGSDYFSAGADLRDPVRWSTESLPFVEQREIAAAGFKMCTAWEEMPRESRSRRSRAMRSAAASRSRSRATGA